MPLKILSSMSLCWILGSTQLNQKKVCVDKTFRFPFSPPAFIVVSKRSTKSTKKIGWMVGLNAASNPTGLIIAFAFSQSFSNALEILHTKLFCSYHVNGKYVLYHGGPKLKSLASQLQIGPVLLSVFSESDFEIWVFCIFRATKNKK